MRIVAIGVCVVVCSSCEVVSPKSVAMSAGPTTVASLQTPSGASESATAPEPVTVPRPELMRPVEFVFPAPLAQSAEPTCGNGRRDPGETCDGDCPTSCSGTQVCAEGAMIGSPATCDVSCSRPLLDTVCGPKPTGCNLTIEGGFGVEMLDGYALNYISLGGVAAGESTDQMLTIRNDGQERCDLTAVELTQGASGAAPASFSVAPWGCQGTGAVEPGESRTYQLTFRPSTAAGFEDAQLRIAYDGMERFTQVFGTSAEAGVNHCVLDVRTQVDGAPATLPFGLVKLGQSATNRIEVQNVGTGPCTVSAVTLDGADFTVSMEARSLPSGAPAGLPFVLAPVEYATLWATFTPTHANDASALVTIVSDDSTTPSHWLTLSGDGLPKPKSGPCPNWSCW